MPEEPDFLDATLSGDSSNSYLTLEEASERMNEFESFDAWDEMEEDDQARLLIRGTRLIDAYGCGWGTRYSETQRLAFPREIDETGEIPDEVKVALLEYVDFRLRDGDGSMNALKDLQAEGVTSQSILGQSTQMNSDESQLPAGARKPLDKIGMYGGGGVRNRKRGDGKLFG